MTPPISSISVDVTLLVLFAGFLHAVWNAIAKSIHDQWLSFTLLNIGTAAVGLLGVPLVGLPPRACGVYLGASVICHIWYQLALMAAYRRGALSVSYPVARGVAPLLATLGGVAFASEHLSWGSLAGVGVVVVGIVALASGDREHATPGAIGWALVTGVAIAGYTVIDGLGVRASHQPAQYAMLLFLVQAVIFLLGALWRRSTISRPSPRIVALGVGGGVISMLAYGIVLWSQDRAPIGVVSALRETGVIWAAMIGVWIFREKGGWRLYLSAVVVVVGVSLLALS